MKFGNERALLAPVRLLVLAIVPAITGTQAVAQSAPNQGEMHELKLLRLELMEYRLMKQQDRIRDMEAELRGLTEITRSSEKSEAAIVLEAAELDERLKDASIDEETRARLQQTRADFIVKAPREAHARRTAAMERATVLAQQIEQQRSNAAVLLESIRQLTRQTSSQVAGR
jgi:hypothetical protein